MATGAGAKNNKNAGWKAAPDPQCRSISKLDEREQPSFAAGKQPPSHDGRDFFVMVNKGPNARNDFHLVDSEEYFYQLKGDIKVRIREGDRIVDHLVREGETFFIPPNVPHAPATAGHIGVVVERAARLERKNTSSLLRQLRALVENIEFRLRRHRPTFQPATLTLERRRAADSKCGNEGPTARTGRAVRYVEDRPPTLNLAAVLAGCQG